MEELHLSLQQLQDQNTLLKAQRNNNVISIDGAGINNHQQQQASFVSAADNKLIQELEALRLDNEKLKNQLQQQNISTSIIPNVSFLLLSWHGMKPCLIFRISNGMMNQFLFVPCSLYPKTCLEKLLFCSNLKGFFFALLCMRLVSFCK